MSFELGGLNSYIDTSAATNAASSKLSGKLSNTSAGSSPEELREACVEFESYFMEQVYKEMLKTIGSEESDSSMSRLVDYFKDNVVQTLSSQTVEQSGGVLAQQLYEQMKRNYGIVETE